MKKGQIVKVYQKPLTSEEFEGKARLVRKYNNSIIAYNGENYVIWEVEFLDEFSPGKYYIRRVKEEG